MKPDRDIYIVSIRRGAKVQGGPLAPEPSAWRRLSREEIRQAILSAIRHTVYGQGAKVWIKTRRETARVAQAYGLRPRTLDAANDRLPRHNPSGKPSPIPPPGFFRRRKGRV